MLRPILAWRPCRVVGIPVYRAIRRLAVETPSARFQLKDSPGIPVFDRLRTIHFSSIQPNIKISADDLTPISSESCRLEENESLSLLSLFRF